MNNRRKRGSSSSIAVRLDRLDSLGSLCEVNTQIASHFHDDQPANQPAKAKPVKTNQEFSEEELMIARIQVIQKTSLFVYPKRSATTTTTLSFSQPLAQVTHTSSNDQNAQRYTYTYEAWKRPLIWRLID
eukprot:scaffold3414_cov183-Ochromonas_danica.AAC.4